MVCQYLEECGGCTEISLDSKVIKARDLLGIHNFQVFKSCDDGFRARAELGIYHLNNKIHFAMRSNPTKNPKAKFICIENCPNLTPNIQKALSILHYLLNEVEFENLKAHLFSLEILSTQTNSLLLSLIYHKKINESWKQKASILRQRLQLDLGFRIYLIGRSKGIKQIVGEDYLTESLEILNRVYFYRYFEGAFTQPNPSINIQMITWVLQHLETSHSKDLLEMYCGCGNFTIPLAQKFRKVLATEISKTSIKAIQFAIQKNQMTNITFVRLSGMECMEALQRIRKFRRLSEIDLDSFDFGAVLIDPPRAGLGKEICNFLQQFQKIIYISCNPISLKQDLETLTRTHKVVSTAFFDQFPHTIHLETIVILEIKPK